MTSINTNASATTALRTLQQTNKALDATQNRVSTGLKIGEAKDNAAYWAISTVLKSDNKALATVKDALGLGAATVDTAYQGLNKAKEVLDEIKSKLTAATQAGINKDTIQAEITELQNQLKSISTSSIFSGENWLSVDSSATAFGYDKSVVASFTRAQNGTVSVGTIDVNIENVALFDANAEVGKAGLLDKDVSLVDGKGTTLTFGGKAGVGNSTLVGGLTTTAGTPTLGSAAVASATKAVLPPQTFTFAAGTSAVDGDDLVLSFDVDGVSTPITVDVASVTTGFTIDTFITAFNAAGTAVDATKDADGKLVFTSAGTNSGPTSTLELTGVAVYPTGTTTGARVGGGIGFTTLAETKGLAAGPAKGAAVTVGAFGSTAVTLDINDTITFDVNIDAAAKATKVTINQAIVNEALSVVGGTQVTDGKIDDVADYQKVVALALTKAGVPASTLTVAVSTNTGDTDKLLFQTVATGATKSLSVGNAVASNGGSTISVETIDISSTGLAAAGATTAAQVKSTLEAYISVVNTAINGVTSAAANLGAVSSRIDLQKTFVDTLMDTIDEGVGNLIDADLSEESTRLQALQTKQQLGIQALSIANSSQQNILRLFQ